MVLGLNLGALGVRVGVFSCRVKGQRSWAIYSWHHKIHTSSRNINLILIIHYMCSCCLSEKKGTCIYMYEPSLVLPSQGRPCTGGLRSKPPASRVAP